MVVRKYGETKVTDLRVIGEAPGTTDETVQNGQEMRFSTVETDPVALSGASTVLGQIAAGAVLMGISTRVTTAITGATGFDLGDGSDADRWGANLPVALDSVSDNQDWTDQSITNFPAATNVVATGVGGSFTGGAVRLTLHYLSFTPAAG